MIADSLEAFKVEPRTDWVKKWPGQAVLCVTQKYWTDEVEKALGSGPEVISVVGFYLLQKATILVKKKDASLCYDNFS